MSSYEEILKDVEREGLAIDLFDRGLVKFGNFTLKNGQWSPVYVDLRPLGSIDHKSELSAARQLRIRDRILGIYDLLLGSLGKSEHIAGLPEATLTTAGMIGQMAGLSVLQLRVKQKEYGTKAAIEGSFHDGEVVRLVDDVITSGTTKLEFAERIRNAGLSVKGIAVLVDREQGGSEQLRTANLPVVAGIGMTALTDILLDRMRITEKQHEIVTGYLDDTITNEST